MSLLHSHFWAKSHHDGKEFDHKIVSHHLLDVGACALRFLQNNPTRTQREALLAGVPPDVHARLCGLLAALHDLGKISVVFQAQRQDLWPTAILGPWPEMTSRRYGHWEATAVLLKAAEIKSALMPVFGADGMGDLLVSAVAGHHGKAPKGEYLSASRYRAVTDGEIGSACVASAAQLCTELVGLFPALRDLTRIRQPEELSFALNGLITLADWVGSDLAYFPCLDPSIGVADYWPMALEAADRALADKGLIPAKARIASLGDLSTHAGAARPMQALAATLAIPGEPQIVIIEDGTGSGKTEAALLLAARMIAAGRGEGIFVALPTMATANAMHARLEAAMNGLFESDATLVLAHGKSNLANALARLGTVNQGDQDSIASHFNAWIGDSRKKAFFADAGAGTIDQAFLSILPKKHLTMRQYALAGRILIVDEAHACDAYMGEELNRLVEMQARLGGSVIVLSATLTREDRNRLVQSYSDGRGLWTGLTETAEALSYPLLTRWSESTDLEEHAVETLPELVRSVEVRPLASRTDCIAKALEAAAKGGAVIMICNTVDAAIECHDAILEAGHDPDRCHLAHARFVVDDRLAIEGRVQELFGRQSTPEARAGRILIGTQVLEQSLDLDADLMISDLAPVDLIVQRAGRLWRHARSRRPVAEPILYLLTAAPAENVPEDWLNDVLGSAVHVYDFAGVMWRTARMLLEKGRLDTPHDLRRFIEAAYRSEEDDLPAALRAKHRQSVGTRYGERTQGQMNVIKPENGYGELTCPSADEDVGTRLGARQVTIRLARREGQCLVPLVRRQDADDRLNWPLSEISVRERWLERHAGSHAPEPAEPALVERTRLAWPEWERNILLLEVGKDGCLKTLQPTGLVYDSRRGLRVAGLDTGPCGR